MSVTREYENRIQSLQWNELRTLWERIENRDTPGWPPGKAFEYLVLRAFQLDGADITWPYPVRLFGEEVEQIDGAIHFSHLSCLVESKDYGNQAINVEPIAKLRNQLLRRPAGTIGLVFSSSSSGFTDPARHLSCFALPQAILLWNGEEIKYALDHRKICQFLLLKYRVCVEQGLPDYDLRADSEIIK